MLLQPLRAFQKYTIVSYESCEKFEALVTLVYAGKLNQILNQCPTNLISLNNKFVLLPIQNLVAC